jgi:hypothetical protein
MSQKAAEFLKLNIKFREKNEELRNDARGKIDSAQQLLSPEKIPELCADEKSYFEGILRIVTDPEGFNRGYPYYFLLKKDTYNSWTGTLDWKQARRNWHVNIAKTKLVSKSPQNEKVVRKLKKLALKRRLESKRESRFLRLQAYLQSIWNSKRFNIIVLFLIVSNFVFTVQQLENTDPARQRYFEKIDLAYTIIFSCGDSPLQFSPLSHVLCV